MQSYIMQLFEATPVFLNKNTECTYIFDALIIYCRYFILFDNYHLPLPVGSFVVLKQPTYWPPTAQAVQRQEVTNDAAYL